MPTGVTNTVVTTGVPGLTQPAPATTTPQPTTGNASIPTTFTNQAADVSGGGFVDDLAGAAANAIKGSSMAELIGVAGGAVSDARKMLEEMLTKAKANGESLDPADVAVAQGKIQEATMAMEMLASADRENRRAAEVWLRG